MKSLVITMLLLCSASFGSMGPAPLTQPVQTAVLNTTTLPVTSAQWRPIVASMTYACSGLLVGNTGGHILQIGKGASGSETGYGVSIPLNTSLIIPINVLKGSRLSVKSQVGDQTSGIVHISCFQ